MSKRAGALAAPRNASWSRRRLRLQRSCVLAWTDHRTPATSDIPPSLLESRRGRQLLSASTARRRRAGARDRAAGRACRGGRCRAARTRCASCSRTSSGGGTRAVARTMRAVAGWDAHADPSHEISFRPARVLLQDFTGVPAIRRPRRDARGDGGARRRRGRDQPADPGRARHRPLGAGGRVRSRPRSSATRSGSSSGTASATPSSAGGRARSTTSVSSRRTPGSSTR